jgi:co-chaperonin GroES (HSP10)
MVNAVRDTILVRVLYQSTVGSGRIIVPDQAKKRIASYIGEVVSIGPEFPLDLNLGDKVLFPRAEGVAVVGDKGELLASLKPERVLAIVND